MDKFDFACQLVEGLASTLTVPGLTLDEATKGCVLVFDSDLVVNVQYEGSSGMLMLSAYLDELPLERAEPLLRELMGANLYWHRTGGGTLAWEEGTNGIILAHRVSVTETDATVFENTVQAFVHQAQRWTDRIAEYSRTTVRTTPTPALYESNGLFP